MTIVLIGAAAAPAPAGAQRRSGVAADTVALRTVIVWLNGRFFAEGRAMKSDTGEEVYVAVAALARALDGPPPPRGRPRPASRLRVDGSRVFAAALGGCDSCPARVTRRVLISSRARAIGREPALPLADVVAAFEARLEVDSGRTLYAIHAGRCTWCVLELR